MTIPLTLFNIDTHPGYVTWEVFGHKVGGSFNYSNDRCATLVTVTCIGILCVPEYPEYKYRLTRAFESGDAINK